MEAIVFIEGRLKVDDPVGAIAVHGVCGTFGVLCVGLFANGSYGAGWNGSDVEGVKGLFWGDAGQFGAQVLGAVVIWTVIFGVAFAFFKIQDASPRRWARAASARRRPTSWRASTCPRWACLAYPDFVGSHRRRGRRLGVRLELGAPAHQPPPRSLVSPGRWAPSPPTTHAVDGRQRSRPVECRAVIPTTTAPLGRPPRSSSFRSARGPSTCTAKPPAGRLFRFSGPVRTGATDDHWSNDRSRSSTRPCATACRSRASRRRWRTSCASPSSSTCSACTTSRAAGRGPTRRTSSSSPAPGGSCDLSTSTLVAFGSTRRPRGKVDDDATLRNLVEAGTSAVCIVAKSSEYHVTQALQTTLDEGEAMIADSVRVPHRPAAGGCSSTWSTSSTATRPTPSSRCGRSRRRS